MSTQVFTTSTNYVDRLPHRWFQLEESRMPQYYEALTLGQDEAYIDIGVSEGWAIETDGEGNPK